MTDPIDEPISNYIEDLAASSRVTREAALTKINHLLYSLGSIQDDQQLELRCLQVWKGLFYAMYMTDKPIPQQKLAERLARFVTDEIEPVRINKSVKTDDDEPVEQTESDECVRRGLLPSCRIAFLTGFWKTMASEWNGLDKWRVDKFLYLIRQIVRATFTLIARGISLWRQTCRTSILTTSKSTTGQSSADTCIKTKMTGQTYVPAPAELIGLFSAKGGKGPLDPTDQGKDMPNGVRLHVLDIYIDEMIRMVPTDEAELYVNTLADGSVITPFPGSNGSVEMMTRTAGLVSPLTLLAQHCPTKSIRVKAKEALQDEQFLAWAEEAKKQNASAVVS